MYGCQTLYKIKSKRLGRGNTTYKIRQVKKSRKREKKDKKVKKDKISLKKGE